MLDSPTRRRAEVLRGLLYDQNKRLLSRLDEEILEACATEDIEGEIIEADEILVKIKEALIDINRTTGEAPEREETPITRSTNQRSSSARERRTIAKVTTKLIHRLGLVARAK